MLPSYTSKNDDIAAKCALTPSIPLPYHFVSVGLSQAAHGGPIPSPREGTASKRHKCRAGSHTTDLASIIRRLLETDRGVSLRAGVIAVAPLPSSDHAAGGTDKASHPGPRVAALRHLGVAVGAAVGRVVGGVVSDVVAVSVDDVHEGDLGQVVRGVCALAWGGAL